MNDQNKCNEEEEFIAAIRRMFNNVFFPLWWKEMDLQIEEDGELVKLAQRVFSINTGATEKSPAAFMFAGFCEGLRMAASGEHEEELKMLRETLCD